MDDVQAQLGLDNLCRMLGAKKTIGFLASVNRRLTKCKLYEEDRKKVLLMILRNSRP